LGNRGRPLGGIKGKLNGSDPVCLVTKISEKQEGKKFKIKKETFDSKHPSFQGGC